MVTDRDRKHPRGRPRCFDRAATLDAIQRVFWRDGLHGTSLNELAAEVGLHKPSLYAAYGDKAAMYRAALDAYLTASSLLLSAAFARPTLRDSLGCFFASDLRLFAGRGCFLLTTGILAAASDPLVATTVRHSLDTLRDALTARIAMGVSELRAGVTVEPAAEAVVAMHMALSARARLGEPAGALELATKRTIDLLCA